MNDFPRQMLRRIVVKYGKEICADAQRCENLLNDLCGSYEREINVLVIATKERVPLDLLAGAGSMPLSLLLTRLEKRLEEQTALTAEAARWAVESWALALEITTETEIESRKQSAESSPSNTNATSPNNPATNNAANSNPSNSFPSKTKTTAPQPFPIPPKTQPPARRTPSPPVNIPQNNPPLNQPIAPPIQITKINPPAIRSGFGFFRGCLVVIFLLIVSTVVLFFGVPYAIEVMRETQRERDNEPPRFPAR